jgi:hypothetical protein
MDNIKSPWFTLLLFFAAMSARAGDYPNGGSVPSLTLAAMFAGVVLMLIAYRRHRERCRRKKVRACVAARLEFRR